MVKKAANNSTNVMLVENNFVGGIRLKPEQIWHEYVDGKQTYLQLVEKYNCSTKTINEKLIPLNQIEKQIFLVS